MIQTINGGYNQYLSSLPEFQNGLPFGVVNKTKTDVGGTYVAANCDCNYIIVCPFRDLVDSIALDKNNKYEVFRCYGGTKKYDFVKYVEDNEIYKIAVTYDSFPKLTKWIEDTGFNTKDWKVLVDEYHLILEDMDFRYDAIDGLLNELKKYNYYTFLSATPINMEFEIDFLKKLPHYKVEWEGLDKITPMRYKSSSLTKGLTRLIQIFLDEGFNVPDVNGDLSAVNELYIFLNSVTTIKQIVDTLARDGYVEPDDIKICCADRIRNLMILGKEYEIESVSSPNKKINFFTKKCFQGCNLFTNNGLIIVASDAYKTHTLIDISTTLEQIAGRLRYNNEFQNKFRNTLIHIYSTNKNIMSDEEFDAIMEDKRNNKNILLSGYTKLDEEEKKVYAKSLRLDDELVSVINGEMIYNPLKEQSFIYKQELRKQYQDGICIYNAYNRSQKFVSTTAEVWNDFNVKMAKAITISYEQLLKEYLENPSLSFELEYPEFKEFKQYLKVTEMNTLRWNKEKMIKRVEDKKNMFNVYKAVFSEGFVSSKELKARFGRELKNRDMDIAAKASLIEDCPLYGVEKVSKYIDGKKVKGYNLYKSFNFKF